MANNSSLQAYEHFLNTPIGEHFAECENSESADARLALFRGSAETVPAYRLFLSENGIDPREIGTEAGLVRLPPVTRENYISKYPLPELCRNGRLEECGMIAVSSGSTASPTFWPRTLEDELSIAWRFEQVFHDSFRAHQRRTLAVICFTLGTWVGGMYTAACCRHLAEKGYPITTVTPGNNPTEILRVVRELAPLFEQTVLLGYPPFLKDVVDTGLAQGVPWAEYHIRFVMAGEVFSEEWRALVSGRVGSTDILCDSASVYGTADAGVLGNETPLSICIRRYLASHAEVARELFGQPRLPTLVQYDPRSRYFEMHEGRLLFTGDNGIPLIRYDILDTGGIVSYDEMLAFLRARGFDPKDELRSAATSDLSTATPPVRRLPFAYVFGRSNFAVSFFGANVYPENIAVGLEQDGIKEWVTGKFVLQVLEDKEHNRSLSVTIELAHGAVASDEKRQLAAQSVEDHLVRLNSEFAHHTPAKYRKPHVVLLSTGDTEYFPRGVKHRYTRGT